MKNAIAKLLTAQWFEPKISDSSSSKPLNFGASAVSWLTGLANTVTEPILNRRVSQVLNHNGKRNRKRMNQDTTQPVIIVVGNLIVGGAGKTPLVAAIAQLLTQHGYAVGMLTGGYKSLSWNNPQVATATSSAKQIGDEAVLLKASTHLPLAAGRDRATALKLLTLTNPELNIVLSDDGLQHNGLKRDIEVVVFDERMIGNGKVLPAGPLREPLNSLQTADLIVAARGSKSALEATLTTPAPIFELQWQLRGFITLQNYLSAMSNESSTLRHPQDVVSIAQLKEKLELSVARAIAVAALGNPAKFFNALADAGIIALPQPLPDHQAIKEAWLEKHHKCCIIMTEKDAVKCVGFMPDATAHCWVAIGSVALDEQFSSALINLIDSKRGNFVTKKN